LTPSTVVKPRNWLADTHFRVGRNAAVAARGRKKQCGVAALEILTRLRVQCHGRHAEVGEFDPETGTLVRRHRSDDEDEGSFRGHYADLGGVTAVFYRGDDDHLWLRLADVALPVEAARDAFEWSRDGATSEIKIEGGDGERINVKYDDPYWPPPSFDPTPFVEAEDFDFGLFVRNVLADPARSARIYRPDAD
jgi:hypothetical protein